jgi:hypothetical protein
MIKINEETQMYIDDMLGNKEELPREFDLFYDLKTKEDLYKEMCMHRRELEGLEDMCDIHNISYTNVLKDELNRLKQSNTFYLLVSVISTTLFIVELLLNRV